MEFLLIVLAIIAVGAIVVLFGLQLVRKKTVTTILNDIRAMQRFAPETPLHDIYYVLAEERTNKSEWLSEFNYLHKLRDAGCFDPRTAPQPEQYAEFMASLEEKIRLQASGVAEGG